MKSLILICAVGMAFGQNFIPMSKIEPIDKNHPLDTDKLRKILKCPEYMRIVIDGRVKGAYCALRAPEPAETIKLPIPKELRQ